jgi:6-pyruvoyltetrahydropterin/6-carboxytetrahydropterin synthase
MFSVTREITFCYGHRILGHAGKCRHLHGHNGRVAVTLEEESLDALGMVADFGLIKDTIGKWIAERLDHRMILRHGDPAIPALEALGEPVVATDDPPTAETLAKLVFDAAAALGLPVAQVTLWETDSSQATYRRSSVG